MNKKNRINLVVIVVSLVITFNSCCTKKECVNAFDMGEIELNGFVLSETQNILISSYSKGSNFNSLIDSSSTSARTLGGGEHGDLFIFSPIDLNAGSDYRIEFIDIGQVYEIIGIQTSFKKCNSCFLGHDDYITLSSYKVNEVLQEIGLFKIFKVDD